MCSRGRPAKDYPGVAVPKLRNGDRDDDEREEHTSATSSQQGVLPNDVGRGVSTKSSAGALGHRCIINYLGVCGHSMNPAVRLVRSREIRREGASLWIL